MGKKRLDWSKIETEYVTTNLSYTQLAEKHKIDRKLVCAAGKREGWVKKRKEYRKKRAEEIENAAIDAAVRNVKALENVASKAIRNLDNYFQDGDIPYKPQDFRQLTGAIKDLTAAVSDIRSLCGGGGEKDNRIRIQVELPKEIEDYAD